MKNFSWFISFLCLNLNLFSLISAISEGDLILKIFKFVLFQDGVQVKQNMDINTKILSILGLCIKWLHKEAFTMRRWQSPKYPSAVYVSVCLSTRQAYKSIHETVSQCTVQCYRWVSEIWKAHYAITVSLIHPRL